MAPRSSDDLEFLRELFKDLSREVFDSRVRLEEKIDNLDQKMTVKVEAIDLKTIDHEKKLEQHSHNFKIITYVFTSGIAGLTGFLTWFWGLFENHK